MFGVKLEQLGGEEQWKALQDELAKVAEWLSANGEGKDMLFLGEKVTFADIQLAAALKWGRTITGEDSAEWKRIAGWHGGKWEKLIQFFEKYTAIDA